jgi:hypothetical protein
VAGSNKPLVQYPPKGVEGAYCELRAGEEVEIYEAVPCCRYADGRWSRSYGASLSPR